MWISRFIRLQNNYNAVSTFPQIALEQKCARKAWLCLDGNTTAKQFYAKIGAEEQNQWKIFYFNKENIVNFLDSWKHFENWSYLNWYIFILSWIIVQWTYGILF